MWQRFFVIVALLLLAAFSHGRSTTVLQAVNNGDNVPVLIYPTFPAAFRDATAQKTWLTWSGIVGTTRTIQVQTKTDDGIWTAPVSVITNPNGDDHGQPASVMDQYGYVHWFCCNHIAGFFYTYTTTARSTAAFAAPTQPSSGTFTFYAPVLVNGEIYLFTTKIVNNTQVIWVQHGTPQSGGGVASWSGGTFITSLPGPSGATWIDAPIVNGNLVCFVWTWQNGSGNGSMINGYYGCYNTTDGSFQNINASTIIANGSLPIDTTTAAANFAVFLSSGANNATTQPAQVVDAGGTIHVIYANFTYNSSSPVPLLETHWNGSAWTSGVSVGGSPYSFSVAIVGIASATDGFDLYWTSATNTMSTVHWSSISGFGSSSVCFTTISPYLMFGAERVLGGIAALNMIVGFAGNLLFNGHKYGDVPVYSFGTGC